MNLIRSIFLLALLVVSCNNKLDNKNQLEVELDQIKECAALSDLRNLEFVNFDVDWANPEQWESSCEIYNVIPKTDTFKNDYSLDFCNDKYRWWASQEKNED